jgi:predicted nuclease of predicted toxin-antitoxin system
VKIVVDMNLSPIWVGFLTDVVQVRSQDVMPDAIGADVIGVLRQHADQLHAGAIITIDEMTSRLRILPIHRKSTPSN